MLGCGFLLVKTKLVQVTVFYLGEVLMFFSNMPLLDDVVSVIGV